jgi:hypothetical protein
MMRLVACLLPAVALVPLSGCLSVVRQGIAEARGAQGELLLIEGSAVARSRHRSVVFQPADTSVGRRICPPELLAAYDQAARDMQNELAPVDSGGEPRWTVSSDLLYFRTKGLLGTAQLLARVQVRSEERLLIDGLLLAESSAFSAGDEHALSRAALRALGRALGLTSRS